MKELWQVFWAEAVLSFIGEEELLGEDVECPGVEVPGWR